MPQALSPNHLTMPPAPEVHLLPAAASDIPRMVDILIAAFSPGPWSSILFPPRLRSTQRDESDWRIQAMSEHLGKPGHRYVVARQQRELEDVSGTEAQSGNYVVGWAHWRVATARDEQRTTEAGTRTAAPPRGLDIAAYEVVVREGKEIEKMARAALGVERWSGAIGEFAFPSSKCFTLFGHHRHQNRTRLHPGRARIPTAGHRPPPRAGGPRLRGYPRQGRVAAIDTGGEGAVSFSGVSGGGPGDSDRTESVCDGEVG